MVDELKGISPKMRKSMDRDELVAFIRKMRGRDFTNEEIKLVREYADTYSIGLAKEKRAPAMVHAKKLGAKNKEEFEFVEEYLENIQTTSPEKFREMYGNVKNVNMDINTAIENKLERHFKKKYKWDNTKTDGGLDDTNYNKYEDELYEAQKEFGKFHSVESGPPGIFGMRESTGWVNHPNNYLDEASLKLEEITGEGLNVDFYKKYTDEVLTKYPKPEKFAHGGRTSTGLNYLLGEDDQNSRVPFVKGKLADAGRRWFLEMMGGAAAAGAAAKSGLLGLFKSGGGKEIVETLTQVPIKDIPEMPAWVKPLINKVIKEGDDVTKTYGTLERQIVHKTKLPDSKTDVLVTQDLTTGDVAVEIGAGKHGWADGHLGQPVRLEYKAGEVIEPTIKKGKEIKGGKTKEEFWVEEAEFTGGHPENVKFEESSFNKFGEHGSDFSEVEEFATGLKKGKGGSGHMASGGRVPFVKGKLAKYATPEGLAELIEKFFPGTTKLGKTSKPMADKTQLRRAIAGFQEREKVAKAISEGPLPGERAGIDVPDMPAGFKLSREKLEQNFPELGLDEIDEIMNLDRELQGTIITMLKNRRLDPDLYDKLLLKYGDTLKFQGEFDKAIRRRKNATGGRVSLSSGGIAGMLGE
jgi:hypothetical protein